MLARFGLQLGAVVRRTPRTTALARLAASSNAWQPRGQIPALCQRSRLVPQMVARMTDVHQTDRLLCDMEVIVKELEWGAIEQTDKHLHFIRHVIETLLHGAAGNEVECFHPINVQLRQCAECGSHNHFLPSFSDQTGKERWPSPLDLRSAGRCFLPRLCGGHHGPRRPSCFANALMRPNLKASKTPGGTCPLENKTPNMEQSNQTGIVLVIGAP